MKGELAILIKSMRTILDMTQAQFAERYSISRISISNYETGIQDPSGRKLLQMMMDAFPAIRSDIDKMVKNSNLILELEKQKKIAVLEEKIRIIKDTP